MPVVMHHEHGWDAGPVLAVISRDASAASGCAEVGDDAALPEGAR